MDNLTNKYLSLDRTKDDKVNERDNAKGISQSIPDSKAEATLLRGIQKPIQYVVKVGNPSPMCGRSWLSPSSRSK